LLLHQIIGPDSAGSIVSGLFQLYYHPSTAGNVSLRQCLSYFFEAYSYSSAKNQDVIASVVVEILSHISTGGGVAISLNVIANQLLELTDYVNLVPTASSISSAGNDSLQPKRNPHAKIGEACAWASLQQCATTSAASAKLIPGAISKTFPYILSRLRIDATWSFREIKRLLFILGHLIRHHQDRTVLTGWKKIVTHLIELDDPSQVLDVDDLTDLRSRLNEIELPTVTAASLASQTSSIIAGKSNAGGKKPSSLFGIEAINMMDEIGDLRD
jgi:hypothetical protein